jgi:pyrroline-5-carboxylate reductase
MRAVAEALAPSLVEDPLVLSIAAGIRTVDLSRWLGKPAVVRAMPNTPALLQCGATGLFAAPGVREGQRETAEAILRAAGLTVWVEDEALLDAVTAVSGSGPAYFFLVMELIENAGTRLGLDREQSRILTLQTALGAARMAMESGVDPAALRAQVTSPGGTTERALSVMGESNLAGIFDAALEAAKERAAEMAREFGAD